MTATDVDRALAEALAKSMRRYRSRTGLSQEALAHSAGIDWKYYQSLENAKGNSSKGSVANPSLQVLWKLSQAYGVELPDLMSEAFGGDAMEYPPEERQ